MFVFIYIMFNKNYHLTSSMTLTINNIIIFLEKHYFKMDFDSGCNDLNKKISNWLEWDKVFIIINYCY